MSVIKIPKHQGNNASRRSVKILLRRQEAYRLWMFEKKPYRDIAPILNISFSQVRNDIHAVIEEIPDEFDDEVRTWKVRQLKRLMKQYDRFDKDAGNAKLTAIDRARAGTLCLGILKEISDITGVRSAVKHEVTGQDGKPINIVTNVILEFSDENGTNESDTET